MKVDNFSATTIEEALAIVRAHVKLSNVKYVGAWRKSAESNDVIVTFKDVNGDIVQIMGGFSIGGENPATNELYKILIKARFSKDDAERIRMPYVTRVNLYKVSE